MSATHTYAILHVSPATYKEIRTLLAAAQYQDQFHQDDRGELIDLHGLAIREEPNATIRKACLNSIDPRCDDCGGPMIHTRLHGYQCAGSCG